MYVCKKILYSFMYIMQMKYNLINITDLKHYFFKKLTNRNRSSIFFKLKMQKSISVFVINYNLVGN